MVRFEPFDQPFAIDEIPTPALLLDLDVVERNLERMQSRADELGVALRPHVKTHKCLEIARAQAQLGAAGWTVSTLDEAAFLSATSGADLTWAFPLILAQLPRLAPLFKRATLRLVVDSPEAVEALCEGLRRRVRDVHVWLKVDCGYHRAGVDPASERALELARKIRDAKELVFDGLLSHSGHGYRERTPEGRRRVAEEERRVMAELAERLRDAGVEVPGVSVGSTPATTAAESLEGVTEVRPGNYVFFDYTQCEIGSCEVRDCALTVLSSVVSSQPGARHSVIDAGALSLSKDPGPDWVHPPAFGRIYGDYPAGELRPEMRVVSLSQEHGIVDAPLAVGSRLRILPNHSCLVVPHFSRYLVARGDRVLGQLPIRRDPRSWLSPRFPEIL